jgi:hypothetical protein
MLASLCRSFRKLRQRAFWKSHVAGGAFVIEVTSREGFFHAHIHAIIYARFIEWKTLLNLWMQVSSGRGVFIQRIPVSQVVRYLSKYVSKPCSSGEITELTHNALSHFRLFSPFGTWYSLSSKFVMKKACCPHCGQQAFLPFDLIYKSLKPTVKHLDTS